MAIAYQVKWNSSKLLVTVEYSNGLLTAQHFTYKTVDLEFGLNEPTTAAITLASAQTEAGSPMLLKRFGLVEESKMILEMRLQ